MPRLDTLSEIQRNTLLTFPAQLNDEVPWTPLGRPLSECRLALVTTAGLHLRADRPFASGVPGGDPSYRAFPSGVGANELLQSHPSIGFDRVGLQLDLNVAFPLDRARELVERGVVGSLADSFYSFIGAVRDPTPIQRETAPEVARLLREDGVDVVLLTGT